MAKIENIALVPPGGTPPQAVEATVVRRTNTVVIVVLPSGTLVSLDDPSRVPDADTFSIIWRNGHYVPT